MKTLFEQLVEQESFRAVAAKAARGGRIGNAGPWALKVPGIPAKPGDFVTAKYTALSADFPGVRVVDLGPAPRRAVEVKDLVPNIGLSGRELTYSQVTGWSASAGGVAEGAAKGESGAITSVVTAKAETIATWLPYTREALQSAEGTAAWIAMVMRLFLSLAEDQAILNNNTANFLGILNVPGIQTQAVGGDTRLDAVRKAVTKVRQGVQGAGPNAWIGFEPTALLVNPADAEDMELLKEGTTNAYLVAPAESAPLGERRRAQYWRVPVIETSAMPAGTGLVGAFDVGAALWTYGDVEVSLSDSHADFFVRNKVAIRIEARELLATYFPKAFCTITGL